MSTVILNNDVFGLVLDEILDQLNIRREKDIIDLAHMLRRVNQYADGRLKTDARPYLDIHSPAALLRLRNAGAPAHDGIESLTIRFHPCTFPISYEYLREIHTASPRLRKLVVDLRLADASTLKWKGRHAFTEVLPVVEELAVIIGSLCTQWTVYDDVELWSLKSMPAYPPAPRLALCGLVHWLRFLGATDNQCISMICLLTTATFKADHSFLSSLTQMQCKDSAECQTIRLVFGDDLSYQQLQELKEAAQRHERRQLRPRFVFEELAVDCRYHRAIDWFADRIQDGTIWNMTGRPIISMNDATDPL
ncbi:hypothetical protein CALCODRAFT_18059 [Calocera cornea HHB12733]|uniref:Uncharacterized protein n=1 Tax=Calocera cornea HHB12733 TaxID=1353952 RepID=A0A165E849_9BASI|nr:hypothetical protein CALCODRAFT_18059 [Calocera cornea HHB12733]